MIIAAVSSPSPLWYLTRGSGIAALLLLTASILLGVASSVRWQSQLLPRFVVAGLHRNLTLLAVLFVVIHVVTTVADSFTSIALKDAIVPFASAYRPIWVGLGALAFDLLLALVLTSLLRVRLGYRRWRAVHWLAYASWPVALLHALGTGSDARFGWMALVGGASLASVVVAVLIRARAEGWDGRWLGAASGAIACAIGIGIWYQTGPSQHGWAARAGTPRTILTAATVPAPVRSRTTTAAIKPLPSKFSGHLTGSLQQSAQDGNGLVTLTIKATLTGTVQGELGVSLRGFPTDGGGVSMTASGVAFKGAGRATLYEGSIVGLQGGTVSANLTAATGGKLHLAMVFNIDPQSGTVSGSLHGARV